MEYEQIKVSDIPPEFFDSIMKHISNYTVGFTLPEETIHSADVALCGTGTLVEFNGHYGILTAHHVMEALDKRTDELVKKGSKNSKEIGLIIAPGLHNYKIPLQHLRLIKIGRGEGEKEGPDLGIVVLPKACIGTLRALESFSNLGLKREQVRHCSKDSVSCVSPACLV
jgi:hypothetical protein